MIRFVISILLLVITILLSVSAVQSSVDQQTTSICTSFPSTELTALRALFNSTNGQSWMWKSLTSGNHWNFTDTNDQQPDPCSEQWQGITCSSTSGGVCHVKTLILDNYNLNGTLPITLSYLTKLTTLQLSSNVLLVGSLPSTLMEMTSLETLLLYDNALEGKLPNTISQLINLQTINMNTNQFIGTIPISIINMIKLISLQIDANYLSGSLPEEIGRLLTLQVLDFSMNQLTGTIPQSLYSIKSLQQVYLYKNIHLFGTISSAISLLQNLINFEIGSTSINGSIPNTAFTIASLKVFEADHCLLDGSIPTNMTALRHLTILDLSDNYLTSSIPKDVIQCQQLTQLALQNNLISHSIPSKLDQITTLLKLYLSHNLLNGSLPEALFNLPRLQYLEVANNFLEGTLSSNLGNLIDLQSIQLQNNQLIGSIPNNIRNLKRLQFLLLENNRLTGSIPNAFANMKYLIALDLSFNNLHGSLPTSLFSLELLFELHVDSNLHLNGSLNQIDFSLLQSLTLLGLSNCSFSGSIPMSIYSLTSLRELYLYSNQLHGSISNAIENLLLLEQFQIQKNQFTGSIPMNMTKLMKLKSCYLSQNRFIGTLPSTIGQMQSLEDLQLYSNFITSSLPESIVRLKSILKLMLYDNLFTNSIPEQVFNIRTLSALEVQNNQFSGSFPTILSTMQFLINLDIGYNQFTGFLPIAETNIQLIQLYIQQNYFSGTINNWNNIVNLTLLNLADNFLSGSINKRFNQVPALTIIEVQNNQFTGPIDQLVNSSLQSKLNIINLINNGFSGNIPTNIFELNSLTYLAMTKNCLHGSIPTNQVCDLNQTLLTLAMDGLHAASNCQQLLFPPWFQINTFALDQSLEGSIPLCVFEDMQVLTTLHLSGNGMKGSLPNNLKQITSSLTQLSLSHNELTGTIPAIFQDHPWNEFDLSFNKLAGSLDENYFKQAKTSEDGNASISLQVNRLSGYIPTSFKDINNINILTGNVFQCQNNRKDLPEHDPDLYSYTCGSDDSNNALIMYFVLILLVVICVVIVLYFQSHPFSTNDTVDSPETKLFPKWTLDFGRTFQQYISVMCSPTSSDDLQVLKRLECLQLWIVQIVSLILIPALFLYGILGLVYSTLQYKYVWSISMAYLSGIVPGSILLVVLILLLIVIFDGKLYSSSPFSLAKLVNALKQIEGDTILIHKEGPQKDGVGIVNREDNLYLIASCVGFLLLNITIVVTVNATYVALSYSNISITSRTFLSIALSCFKEMWSKCLVYVMKWKIVHRIDKSFGHATVDCMYIAIMVFNTIVAPLIASAFVNPNCFYYAVVPSENVDTSLEITFCSEITTTNDETICTKYSSTVLSTSYQPAFSYSYSCTSSLLTNFVPVWIYMLLLNGIIIPIVTMCSWSLWSVSDVGVVHWAQRYLPSKLVSISFLIQSKLDASSSVIQIRSLAKSLIDERSLVLIFVSRFAIIVCFGVLFPPIAFIGGLSLIVELFVRKLNILRFKVDHDTMEMQQIRQNPAIFDLLIRLREFIIQESQQTNLYVVEYLLHSILWIAACIWSWFLFDIIGDELGWKKSIFVFPVMWMVAVVITLHLYLPRSRWLNLSKQDHEPEVGHELISMDRKPLENKDNTADVEQPTEIRNPIVSSDASQSKIE